MTRKRRGYSRVKGGIGKSYDKLEGVIVSVGRKFNMLTDTSTRKELNKLDCLSYDMVINMLIEVSSDNDFVNGGGCV